jgi:hypothetical protein
VKVVPSARARMARGNGPLRDESTEISEVGQTPAHEAHHRFSMAQGHCSDHRDLMD